MSDSFFHQSLSPPQQTASLKSRKTRTAPPPPPPAPAAAAASARTIHATNSAAPFYYGNVPPRSSAPPPPPPPSKQRQSHTTTSHSSGSTAAKPFYTTSSTSTNNRTAGGYSASGASYYGTPAPAAYTNNGSATMTTSFANTKTGDATTNHEWNTNATNNTRTTTSSDWYSAAPQQQQSQSQYTPSQPQPGYTDYTQPSSFSTSTLFDASASELMEGSIGTNAQEFSTFLLPQQPTATMQSSSNIMDDEDDEAPLLEELGVNLPHIFLKTKAVVLPFSKFGMQAQQVLHEDDNDLAGPLVFALLLGGELLLSGKLQFSYIYGFCSLGCLFLTLVLNLMSPALPVSIWTVASILGYALLPVNILAVCKILLVDLVRLEKAGRVLGLLTICWCTVASTRLLEQKCGMRAQRYLLAYPIALLYSAFVMITIF